MYSETEKTHSRFIGCHLFFRVYIKVAVILFLISIPITIFAAPQLDVNTERIMKVTLADGTLMEESLFAHQVFGDWFLPLEGLAKSLDLMISTTRSLGLATGFILTEDRKFELFLKQCRVEIKDKSQSFPCDAAIGYEDDIYVKMNLIEQWLPIRIKVNSFESEIRVDPQEPLPVQESKKREKAAIQASRFNLNDQDLGYPIKPMDHRFFEGISLDQQLHYGAATMNGQTASSFQHSTSLTGQLFKMDALTYFLGAGANISQGRVTMSRSAPDGGLLGSFLNARQIQLMDVDLPTIPLVTKGQLGRGLLVTNRQFNVTTNFGTQDFKGTLLPGWEVILYRNGVLIDRKVSDGVGNYLFNEVALLYGKNDFLLSYYGPQGQRREERVSYWIDSSLLQSRNNVYRLAVTGLGLPNAKLSLEYSLSLFKYLSSSIGLIQTQLGTDNTVTRYATLGVATTLGSLFAGGTFALMDKGGRAFEGLLVGGLSERSTFRFTFDKFTDFRSELFNTDNSVALDSQLVGDLSLPFDLSGILTSNWSIKYQSFVNQSENLSIGSRLSARAGPVFLSHTATYQLSPSLISPYSGIFSPFITTALGQFRMALNYQFTGIQQASIQFQKTLNQSYSYSLGYNYSLLTGKRGYNLLLSKVMKFLTLSVDGSMSDMDNYQLGLGLSYSLTNDSGRRLWHLSGLPQAQLGSASVLVFLDANRNGIWDPGEERVSNAQVYLSRRSTEYKTNKDGIVYCPTLTPYISFDVSVSLPNTVDPVYQLQNKGIRFYPQPGTVTNLAFPLVTFGSIDGTITKKIAGRVSPGKGILVLLKDSSKKIVKKTKADLYGTYFFDQIVPGSYSVSLEYDAKGLDLKGNTTPGGIPVIIPKEGGFESGKDFSIE